MGYFFSEEESQKLVSKISEIEEKTQGEIRIHIEDLCDVDVMDRAIEVFNKLKMYNTDEKTGVLIYLAMEDRKTSIIGDSGIDAKVSNDFWNTVLRDMESFFANNEFIEGLMSGLDKTGQVLIKNFPKKSGNQNELPNEISYGKI